MDNSTTLLKGADAVTEQLLWFLNPNILSLPQWLGLLALKAIAVALFDVVVIIFLRLIGSTKMPSRTPPIMKGLQHLGVKDCAFISFNQVIEVIFIMHLYTFVASSPIIDRELSTISLGNTLLPFYVAFVLDDFMYYWAHRAMHLPSLYAWCHKHHHRQALPTRGYFDAANENPMEQVIALCILQTTFNIITAVSFSVFATRVHAASFPLFLAMYAVTAMLNHTEYDVQFGVAGLFYTVRAHEMHHRIPTCNYVQNVIIWDKLFGTFRSYKGGRKEAVKEQKGSINTTKKVM